MAFSLTWLPDVLRDARLKVALQEGWEHRGHGDVGQIMGIICHHTGGAGPERGNMPSLGMLTNGRPASPDLAILPGPLAHLGLGRDGSYFVIAAGRALHAGTGVFKGEVLGNSSLIGIQAENTGKPSEPWPQVQLDAYHRGVAAILKTLRMDETFCYGHKECALPKGRKNDPNLDMEGFRTSVAEILNGWAPLPTLIPAAEPPTRLGASTGRPTLRRGHSLWGGYSHDLVEQVQTKVKVRTEAVGRFGPKTEAAVRAFQRKNGLVPDGIVGPRTWRLLDRA
jgi:peptidoglycan hydrolase-like protein with peptidoglycan-binding domain